MPRVRPSPLGVALTAFEIWRRLPPSQRRMVLNATRTHGPRFVAAFLAATREHARRRRP